LRGEIRRDISAAALAHNLFALYFSFLLRWLGSMRELEQLKPGLREILELQLIGLRRTAYPRKQSRSDRDGRFISR